MSYTVRPISDRTPFTGRHRASLFDSTWSSTETILLRELRLLGARNAVVELDLTEAEIKSDGRPYARARISSPAVRVAFESKHGPLTYATDRFWTWQDNVRAIALGLEALRKVDRYGITERGEQYAGFKALPAGRAVPASHMTRTTAAELLERIVVGDEGMAQARNVARILAEPFCALDLWKRARVEVHPDRRDGDRTLWDQVETAGTVLEVTG